MCVRGDSRRAPLAAVWGLHVIVALLVAPQTEGRLEGSVAEFAHVRSFKCQGGQRRRMVKERVGLVRATWTLRAV